MTAHVEPSRNEVWRMFNNIAPHYDAVNRILSAGVDIRWRRAVGRFLPADRPLRLLDVATGTADQLLLLMDRHPNIVEAVGIDLAEIMLEIGRRKIEQKGLSGKITLKTGDALRIPEPPESFDVCTISFGIRNVMNVVGALREMHRVLKPGGRVVVLEFSRPERAWFRACYFFYLKRILPHLGGVLSGDPVAYHYLNRTIQTFPSGEQFCALMREGGFSGATAHPLTFGIATIYVGDKAG